MSWLRSLAALLLILATTSSCVDLIVDPSGFWLIPEDTNMTLTLSLRFNYSNPLDVALNASGSVLVVEVVPDEDWKLNFINRTAQFTTEDVANERNQSLMLSGYYWGRTQLSFFLNVDRLDDHFISSEHSLNGSLLRDDVAIGVNRAFSIVDNLFMGIITTFILANTINMGCQLNLRVIWECLRRPLGPACGFLSQFVFMPLFSYWMGYLFFTNPLFRLGLFTLGCSPGGLMSNFWTLIYNGDINLSITMTFVSTIAAMGMMPLWMFTLGKSIVQENDNLRIPFSNLAISLVSLTVPLAVGIIIRYKRPIWAEKLSKIIKPFTLGILLFFLTVGIYNSYKILLLMTLEMYIAGFLVAMSGFLFGAIFASVFCLKRDQIIAISIETAMQNVGVAYIVLKLSLPSPDGDIGSLPLMAQGLLTGISLQTVFWVSTAVRRLCCRSSPEKTSRNDVEIDIKDSKEVSASDALLRSEGASVKGKIVVV